MKEKNQKNKYSTEKSLFLTDGMTHAMHLAIVGGGRACKFFIDLLRSEPLPYLNINILGVCDINPEAEGFVLANKLGIYTTSNLKDLFKIKNLNSIIDLTGSREVWLEIIRFRPKKVGVLEHNIGGLMRRLFDVNQSLESAERLLVIEKTFSDFLIQQSTAAIVILNTENTEA